MTGEWLGKKILITGSSRGIGFATAKWLKQLGAEVVVNSRDAQQCYDVAEQLGAIPLPFDVTDEAAVKDAMRQLRGEGLFGLVHCAGSMLTRPFHQTALSQLRQQLQVHVESAFLLSQYASRLMITKKNGSIVLISSVVAEQGAPGQAAYVAAKSALLGLNKALAKELAPFGIRINVVAPGVIDTDLIKDLSSNAIKQITDRSLVSRLGEPEEVARMIAFVLSDQSSFITGQTFRVNGGLVL